MRLKRVKESPAELEILWQQKYKEDEQMLQHLKNIISIFLLHFGQKFFISEVFTAHNIIERSNLREYEGSGHIIHLNFNS